MGGLSFVGEEALQVRFLRDLVVKLHILLQHVDNLNPKAARTHVTVRLAVAAGLRA